MFSIKKIDSYLLKRFAILLIMTFLICIFILLMQFLWKHVNDLVGKGVEWSVLGEFFMYASITLVPMALPLAILLASLMTFGNLGENFELTAMKSAGISLFRIMRSLILLISLICVGAFFFSNDILPITQNKLWTLVVSLKQKSPEFDIPPGEFYTEIPNINLYVKKKDKGILREMMIYDFSSGFENATVFVADSGKVQFTKDNKYILLTMFDGESFENLKRQQITNSYNNIPYRREIFKFKQILIDFDNSFNRLDESLLKNQHISKNLSQLSHSIDSVKNIIETQRNQQAKDFLSRNFNNFSIVLKKSNNTVLEHEKNKNGKNKSADSLFLKLKQTEMKVVCINALSKAKSIQDQVGFNTLMLSDIQRYDRLHHIEWHRKFTLSFACLIFFFIGAPLGAIIRKGGFGMPIVTSVVMFIFYYIIDNTGYKMARQGVTSEVFGMWLSSLVLLIIGIFLTYKAVNDAKLFNSEEYTKALETVRKKFSILLNQKKNR